MLPKAGIFPQIAEINRTRLASLYLRTSEEDANDKILDPRLHRIISTGNAQLVVAAYSAAVPKLEYWNI
jgi:hypothetical protein